MTAVVVGSLNPVKAAAVNRAFTACGFSAGVSASRADSGVPGQPIGEATMLGALNRVNNLRLNGASADFYVAVEGGIISLFNTWYGFGCAAVASASGQTGTGTSALFPLPATVVERLLSGEELGDVIDSLSGEQNTKHRGGAIGFLTNGVINRDDLYFQGIVAALIPFINVELFNNSRNY